MSHHWWLVSHVTHVVMVPVPDSCSLATLLCLRSQFKKNNQCQIKYIAICYWLMRCCKMNKWLWMGQWITQNETSLEGISMCIYQCFIYSKATCFASTQVLHKKKHDNIINIGWYIKLASSEPSSSKWGERKIGDGHDHQWLAWALEEAVGQ